MAVTDVLRKAFPFLSLAASFGGPLGTMAASAVGKALNLSKAPAAGDITDVIAGAMADPAGRAALIQAEQQFQLQMTELGFKNAEELEQIAAADRADARALQAKTNSWLPAILAGAAVLTLLFCIYMIGFRTLPVTGKDAMLILLGAVIASYKDVYGYVFGSSAGSDRKTELLAAK